MSSENWMVIFKSDNLNTVEILKSVLIDNNINAIIINKMDSMLHLNLSNSARAEILVRKEDVMRAKFIISKQN